MNSLDQLQRAKAPKGFEDTIFEVVLEGQKSIARWLRIGIAAMLIMGILNAIFLYELKTNWGDDSEYSFNYSDDYAADYFIDETP